ncbi:uncharacterized protein LOC129969277 [Argiope bruennichi]|uniref:uncharacterized protein LOC129969277 n=1 Tax=Argiope bruennichi TaxID=94029 RepID=UPI002495804A|nr:uncharacterized protein LOC129969277 [Argiope bruennichi]XP_055939756.1 uncharacterized protein LOC129969277 [Argiope bruennichi]
MIPVSLFIASCLTLVISDYISVSPEERKAIQERLDELQIIEAIFRAILKGEDSSEARNEANCLPLGAECSFTSGPRCCSVRSRCVIWDRQGSDDHGNAKWTSHCREYNFGKGMDAIDKFFKNLG